MKKMAVLRRSGLFPASVVLALASAGSAFAENISRTFEFGAGTSQPRSHVRTYPVPCGTVGGVAAVVKFRRLGRDGASNDPPIVIEFREPDTAANVEGPIVEAKPATAKRIEQTVIIRSQASNRGCNLPWRVRVRYANDGTAPVQVFGTARIDFDGRAQLIQMQQYYPTIIKGSSVTLGFGTSAGFEQGVIDVRAEWRHSVVGSTVLGSNDLIKLKWQLIDPNGTTVKTVEAYSNQDSSPSPRMVLIYRVPKHSPGQWKMKITNMNASDDVAVASYHNVKFTPGCP